MKILRLLIPIMVLVGVAMASEATLGPEWDNSTLGKLTYAYQAGQLSYEDYLTYRVIAMHAAGSFVPTQYLGQVFSPMQFDGTPLMTELRFNWTKLSAQQKELIRQATGIAGWSSNSPNSVSYRFDWDGAYAYYDTPEGHVRVHYETTGTHATTLAAAQQLGAWHEQMHNVTDLNAPPTGLGSGYERDDTPLAGQRIDDGGLNPLRDAYNATGETPQSYYPEGADFGFGPGGTPQGDNRCDVYIRTMAANVGGYTQYEYKDPETTRYAYGSFIAQPGPWDTFGYSLSTTLHEGDHAFFQGFYDVLDEPWYKEATSTWSEDELWNHPDSYSMDRCSEYLSEPWFPLDYWNAESGGTANGYRCAIWNFFITDYGKAVATPGSVAAEGLYNFWMVRRVWEAMANGDYWYSKDETVNRNGFQGMDMAFDYYDEPMNDYVDQYAMLQKWFADFTKWNWYTGSRADSDHYRWGSLWQEVATTGEYDTYPVDEIPFYQGTLITHKPDHLSSNYYIFSNVPASGMKIEFINDPANPESSIDWKGWVFTPSGGTWTATAMHTPRDGVIRLNFGGSPPSQVGLCIADCAMSGADLVYTLKAEENTDNNPPNVTLAVARPNHNPEQFEVIVGSDDDLYGVAVASADFTYSGTHINTDPDVYPDANTFTTAIPMTLADNNRTTQGVFNLPGIDGSGSISIQVADTSGNIVYKEKSYSAAGLNGIGGDLELGKCKLFVPQGALSESTWFTIVADPELAQKYNQMATKLRGVASATGAQFYGDAYDIEPGWVNLNKNMTVALSYADFGVDESHISIQRIEGNKVHNIGGTVDRLHQRIVADISSPGTYILGIGQNDGFGDGGTMPSTFFLGQNYPNPVVSATTIRYSVGTAKNATIKVYALNGALVRTLQDGPSSLGQQAITWDGKDATGKKVAAGVYVYTLNADGQTATRKMVIAH